MTGPSAAQYHARSRQAKIMAILAMVAVFILSLTLSIPPWALTAQGISLCAVAFFIATRPD